GFRGQGRLRLAPMLPQPPQHLAYHASVFGIDEGPQAVCLRCPSCPVSLFVDADTELILEELVEGPIGEVENVAASHLEDLVKKPHLPALQHGHGRSLVMHGIILPDGHVSRARTIRPTHSGARSVPASCTCGQPSATVKSLVSRGF